MNIYTGFRVSLRTTLENLAVLNTASAGLQKLSNAKAARLAARTLAERADNFCAQRHLVLMDNAKPASDSWRSIQHESLLESVLREQDERQEKCRLSPVRDPAHDCDITLSLRFHPDTGDVLGMVQEERAGALDWLTSQGEVQEYSYFTSSERPKHMALDDWEARGKNWRRVLGSNSVCLTNTTRPTRVEASEVARAMPTLDERVSRLAKNRLLESAIATAMPSGKGTEVDASTRMRIATRIVMDTDDAMKTPGTLLHAEYKALQDRYRSFLPADLTQHFTKAFGELP